MRWIPGGRSAAATERSLGRTNEGTEPIPLLLLLLLPCRAATPTLSNDDYNTAGSLRTRGKKARGCLACSLRVRRVCAGTFIHAGMRVCVLRAAFPSAGPRLVCAGARINNNNPGLSGGRRAGWGLNEPNETCNVCGFCHMPPQGGCGVNRELKDELSGCS